MPGALLPCPSSSGAARDGAIARRVGDIADTGAWLRETLVPETLVPETLGPETLVPGTLRVGDGLE